MEKECTDKIKRKYSTCYFCSVCTFNLIVTLHFLLFISSKRFLRIVTWPRRSLGRGGGWI